MNRRSFTLSLLALLALALPHAAGAIPIEPTRFLLDLTDAGRFPGGGPFATRSATVAGVTFTLSGRGGGVAFDAAAAPGGSFCGSGGTLLKCDTNGAGIGPDARLGVAEWLDLAFSEVIDVTRVFFFDLPTTPLLTVVTDLRGPGVSIQDVDGNSSVAGLEFALVAETTMPEPASVALAAFALAGLAARRSTRSRGGSAARGTARSR